MADSYTVKITAQAREQIQDISHYIAVELQAPNAALRLLDRLEKEISSLSQLPHRIALTEEEPWHSYGVHKMCVKNFLVYFWIDEAAGKVQVTAVVYGRRDQMRQRHFLGAVSDIIHAPDPFHLLRRFEDRRHHKS